MGGRSTSYTDTKISSKRKAAGMGSEAAGRLCEHPRGKFGQEQL